MAVVAQVPLPNVQQSAQPLGTVDVRAPAEAFGANVLGEGAEKLGTTAQQAGGELAQRALQLQGLTNKANADTASSGFQVSSYAQLDAFRSELPAKIAAGGNALDLANEFSTNLANQRQLASKALGNPMAQDMFDQDSRRVGAYITSQANSAALTGQKDYIVKSNQSAIAGQQQFITANYDNPDAIDAAKKSIDTHWMAIGATTGLDPQAEMLNSQRDVSHALEMAVKHTAGSDAARALEMTSDYEKRGYLTAEDASNLRGGLLQPALRQFTDQTAMNLVGAVTKGVPQGGVSASGASSPNVPTPASVAAAFPGATLTSGLRTPEHNAAVGGVPDSHHLQGTAEAPGAMDFVPPKGMDMGAFAAGLAKQYPGSTVLNEGNHIHVTASPYANTYATGQATPSPLAALETAEPALQATAVAQAKAFAEAHGINVGEAEIAAAQSVNAEISRQRSAYVGQNSATVSGLLTTMDGGPDGSGPKLTSLGQLFAFPGAQDAYKSLTGPQQEQLQGHFRANASEITLPRLDARQQLYGMMTTTPQTFVNADLTKYDLTTSDLKYFMDAKAKAAAQTPVALDRETAAALRGSSAVTAVTTMAKSDPTGWGVGGDKYNTFVGALHGEVEGFHAAAGNEGAKMSDKDYDRIVANVFANSSKWSGVPNDALSQSLVSSYKAANGGKLPPSKLLAEVYYKQLEAQRAGQR